MTNSKEIIRNNSLCLIQMLFNLKCCKDCQHERCQDYVSSHQQTISCEHEYLISGLNTVGDTNSQQQNLFDPHSKRPQVQSAVDNFYPNATLYAETRREEYE